MSTLQAIDVIKQIAIRNRYISAETFIALINTLSEVRRCVVYHGFAYNEMNVQLGSLTKGLVRNLLNYSGSAAVQFVNEYICDVLGILGRYARLSVTLD